MTELSPFRRIRKSCVAYLSVGLKRKLLEVDQDNLRFKAWELHKMPEIDVEDQQIYYEVVGEGPHTVVLIPGFIGTILSDFAQIFPALNKTKFRWICLDPPGYGRSRPKDAVVDLQLYERCGILIAKLMQKLGFEKYSIAGWSQGGAYGVRLAEHYPENVLKLVIWGTFAFGTKRSLFFHERSACLDLWSKDKLDEKLICFDKEYLQQHLQDMAVLVRKTFEEKRGKYLGELPSLTCPTLILHGQKDNLADELQPLAWKSAIPNSRIQYFPQAGHDIHLKHTAEFLKLVEEFLER
ncbi:unnamed protein product [Allacma fusca]|uniref:AB hydrolase-1 domain-containing protein n=1 Tax=Allacma fusca TaxID=39272 RepID=A0A8J2K2N8_9HEXA|nr:unnamed protein product [Allacma fusca]